MPASLQLLILSRCRSSKPPALSNRNTAPLSLWHETRPLVQLGFRKQIRAVIADASFLELGSALAQGRHGFTALRENTEVAAQLFGGCGHVHHQADIELVISRFAKILPKLL